MQVIGETGGGKTTIIEQIIRHNIRNGHTVLLVGRCDRRTERLCRRVLAWLGECGFAQPRVVFWVDGDGGQ